MPHDKKHSSQNLPQSSELGKLIQYSDSVIGYELDDMGFKSW